MSIALSDILAKLKFHFKCFSQDTQISYITDLIALRVLIARLGESENNLWWNSSILSSFGKTHLSEFFPRVLGSKRILLSFSTCSKVERKAIFAKSFYSLFNLGYNIESKVTIMISNNQAWSEIDNVLGLIESFGFKLKDIGWTRSLGCQEFDLNNLESKPSSRSIKIGTISRQANREHIPQLIQSLACAYGHSYDHCLVVPYYEIV